MRALLALLVAMALPACGNRPHEAEASATRTPALTPAQLSFLRFEPVAETDTTTVGDASGTIEFDEERTARLNPAVAGRVAELLVRVGDPVEAERPLVALDSADVRTAEADYVRAESDRLLARKAAERAERLHAARAIADKDRLQAQQDAHKADAEYERARAALDRLHLAPGERTSRYLLRAPFAGTVVERKALVGMQASPESAEPLAVVSDLGVVRVVVRLPERQLGLLRPGQAIGVRVDAYGEEFPGAVVAVGDVIDDATRTVPVRCTVPNPDHRLKPAMFARVTLRAPPGLRLVTVPVGAVLADGLHSRVIVRRPNGALEARQVEVGAEMNGRVQVLSGVAVGDEVVTEGALFAAQALAG